MPIESSEKKRGKVAATILSIAGGTAIAAGLLRNFETIKDFFEPVVAILMPTPITITVDANTATATQLANSTAIHVTFTADLEGGKTDHSIKCRAAANGNEYTTSPDKQMQIIGGGSHQLSLDLEQENKVRPVPDHLNFRVICGDQESPSVVVKVTPPAPGVTPPPAASAVGPTPATAAAAPKPSAPEVVAPAIPAAPTLTGTVLSVDQERTLKPKDTFRECTNCPVMIVVPAGNFTMGSPSSDPERGSNEGPQHEVTIAKQFAVGLYELTFAEWDACVADGGCNGYKPESLFGAGGGGTWPAANVSWDDAKAYVAWIVKETGKTYRLLSESEYEYVTRAGTTTVYPWGDDIQLNGQAMAKCDGCGGIFDKHESVPVGSFPPNKFGLYDMVGNVAEWTEDCGFTNANGNYDGAPTDGSAWSSGACLSRVLRGGSWANHPNGVRSAARGSSVPDGRLGEGFRVARTLNQ
jgi:formylglycine-generating enzyme required for sulfatase activity